MISFKILYLPPSFLGSSEPDGSDQHRHASERRPQHTAARERLQWSDTSEADDPDAQHCSQHTFQVTLLSPLKLIQHCDKPEFAVSAYI